MTEQNQNLPSISDHGLIGDLRTTAHVAINGTISWFCPHRFDQPSVFGSLIGGSDGGHWQITPRCEAHPRQFYLPETNVLVTRHSHDEGVIEVHDFDADLETER